MTLYIDYNSVYHRKDRKLTDQVVHAEPRCRTGAAGTLLKKSRNTYIAGLYWDLEPKSYYLLGCSVD